MTLPFAPEGTVSCVILMRVPGENAVWRQKKVRAYGGDCWRRENIPGSLRSMQRKKKREQISHTPD
jgi:hypothetical protein